MADRYDHRNALRRSADPAENIAAAIWDDVTDRRGWRQEAGLFGEEVCIEIMNAWSGIIRAFLNKESSS